MKERWSAGAEPAGTPNELRALVTRMAGVDTGEPAGFAAALPNDERCFC